MIVRCGTDFGDSGYPGIHVCNRNRNSDVSRRVCAGIPADRKRDAFPVITEFTAFIDGRSNGVD